MMAFKDEVTTDIYRQMIDLQEKLRQSEAERLQLKEMFNVLVKTFREEEDMRLRSLESRYHTFLEDCAKRSCRNEKILRSVERVESGANALHAKTERLKLLRSHYEAYLERVISTWRQPAALRYGPSPLPSAHETDISRRNRLMPEENAELLSPNYIPFGPRGRSGKSYSSNPVITSEYFAKKLSDDEKYMKSFHSKVRRPEESYLNRREFEERGTPMYCYDKFFHQGDIGFQHWEPSRNPQPKVFRGRFEDDPVIDDIEGLESALNRKLALRNKSDMPIDVSHREGLFRQSAEAGAWGDAGNPELSVHKQARSGASPIQREERWLSNRLNEALPRDIDNFGKNHSNIPPRFTREPVEIKKPEIIVGKAQPESSIKVDYFNNNTKVVASPPSKAAQPENLFQPIRNTTPVEKIEPESLRIEDEIRTSSPQAKWSLLKHKRTIDKLKETLSYEDAQNVTELNKHGEKPLIEKKSPEPLSKGDETDVSQSLSNGWKPDSGELTASGLDVQPNRKEGNQQKEQEPIPATEMVSNEFAQEYQEKFQEQQKDINEPAEEVYEDNEESYPESYYEQPPKSDYSRDIVSNVILEEDENEVNMQDELPEPVQSQEILQNNNVYDESQYNVCQENNIAENYNEYNVGETGDIKAGENGYQNFQQTDPGQDYNMYAANYSEIPPQDGYTYSEQDASNYNTTNAVDYNTAEQYPNNADTQQYYESQQTQGEMGQGENYDNAYNQNYENNAAIESYNEGEGTYQQEYAQAQDGTYYNQGEYEGYYQGQPEQNGEYPGSDQQENIGYAEPAAYPEGGAYADGSGNNLPLRQSNLSHLLDSDSESFQMEHGSAPPNTDSDFDFSMSQQQ